MQSVLTYYVFSNGLQKIEKKKTKWFAFERGIKILSLEFCCNIVSFPNTFWISGILSLKPLFIGPSIRAEESKFNWYFHGWVL